MSAADEQKPVWLEEGLAEVFSTFEVRKDQAEWGRAIGEHVLILNRMAPLSLAQLLAVGRGELFHGDSLQTGIVYAESWAFVHYLIFGKHNIPRTALGNYVKLLQTTQQPGEAMQQAFGRTQAELERDFRRYYTNVL